MGLNSLAPPHHVTTRAHRARDPPRAPASHELIHSVPPLRCARHGMHRLLLASMLIAEPSSRCRIPCPPPPPFVYRRSPACRGPPACPSWALRSYRLSAWQRWRGRRCRPPPRPRSPQARAACGTSSSTGTEHLFKGATRKHEDACAGEKSRIVSRNAVLLLCMQWTEK